MTTAPDNHDDHDDHDDRPVTYGSYLELDALLSLQHPRAGHPDEMLFIVVHQASELWFRLILHELERLALALHRSEVWAANDTLMRLNGVMRIVTGQLHALDTLPPQRFAQFRGQLGTSSGSQSAQFRAIELRSGLRAPEYLAYVRSSVPLDPRVQTALDAPTLAELFGELLARRGVAPRDLYAGDAHPELRMLAESLLSYEQEFGMWRFLHVQLVERIIGPATIGTGGSLGAHALRETLGNRFFPELWAVRGAFY